jgi:hypothetical protein
MNNTTRGKGLVVSMCKRTFFPQTVAELARDSKGLSEEMFLSLLGMVGYVWVRIFFVYFLIFPSVDG